MCSQGSSTYPALGYMQHEYPKANVNRTTLRIVMRTLRRDVVVSTVVRNMSVLSLAAFPQCRLFFSPSFSSHQILLHLYDMQLMSHRIIEIRN